MTGRRGLSQLGELGGRKDFPDDISRKGAKVAKFGGLKLGALGGMKVGLDYGLRGMDYRREKKFNVICWHGGRVFYRRGMRHER
jgi:hypothetical protein